jgi:hypothetical protein
MPDLQPTLEHALRVDEEDSAKRLAGLQATADRIMVALLTAMVLATLSIWIWGLNRGFDILDEGFYALMVQRPMDYPYSSTFHVIVSKFHTLTGNRIIDLRVLQMLSIMVSTPVLTLGFWSWLAPRVTGLSSRGRTISLLFSILGGELFYAIFPPDISYNGLTYFLCICSAGLIFFSYRGVGKEASHQRLLLAGCGLLQGLLMFVKIPAFGALLVVTLLWISLNRSRVVSLITYLSGIALSLAIFFSIFLPLNQVPKYFEFFKTMLSVPNAHSFAALAQSYRAELFASSIFIAKDLGVSLFLIAICAYLGVQTAARTNSKLVRACFAILPIGVVTGTLLALQNHWQFYDWYLMLYATALLIAEVILLREMTSNNKSSTRRSFEPVLGFLFVISLPFCSSFGTTNPILVQAATCFSPICLALGAMSFSSSKSVDSVLNRSILIVGFAGLLFARYIYGYVYHPYCLWETLFAQTRDASALPNLKGMRLSDKALDSFIQVNDVLKRGNFHSGDPVVALYNLPGVVYAVGGRAPASAWMRSDPSDKGLRPIWFREIGDKEKGPLFLLTTWDPGPSTLRYMHESGLSFPSELELLGTTVLRPYMDVDRGTDDRYLGGEIRIYKRKTTTGE